MLGCLEAIITERSTSELSIGQVCARQGGTDLKAGQMGLVPFRRHASLHLKYIFAVHQEISPHLCCWPKQCSLQGQCLPWSATGASKATRCSTDRAGPLQGCISRCGVYSAGLHLGLMHAGAAQPIGQPHRPQSWNVLNVQQHAGSAPAAVGLARDTDSVAAATSSSQPIAMSGLPTEQVCSS